MQVNNDEVRDYFSKLGLEGSITKVVVPRDHVSKNAKGFGFVTFNKLSDVQKIINMPKDSLKHKGR